MTADVQRQKVYRWEQKAIAPIHDRIVRFEDAQTFIDGVWLAMGLLWPPEVVPMARQARRVIAKGGRLTIHLPPEVQAWVLVHELAHALTNTAHDEGDGEGHGPDFMGMYLKLLDRVLSIPLAYTMYSLQAHSIQYNLGVQPRFADGLDEAG
jgi:hypothetical protein